MRKPHRLVLVAVAAVMATFARGGAAAAGDNSSGFQTSQPAMLTPLAPGSTVTPIMNVGETLGSGYKLESIPGGVSLDTGVRDAWTSTSTTRHPLCRFRSTPPPASVRATTRTRWSAI